MMKRFREFYDDGKLKEKGFLKNGVKHGRFVSYEYFEEDKPEVLDTEYLRVVISAKPEIKRQVKGIYKNGLANGEYEIFDNDIVVEKGFFKDGKAQGPFQIWIPPTNTRLNLFEKILSFYQRKAQGRVYRRAGCGEFIEGHYLDGKYHGITKTESWVFERGETQICNWVMGIKEGADTVLFDTGAVRRVYHFRNGALHGLAQHFDKSGRIEEQRRWVDGILQGPYKEREALFDNMAGELFLTLERGRYKDGEKAGPYVKYEGYRSDLFKFQRGGDMPVGVWTRGIHE